MSKQPLSTATVVATVDALIEKRITWETGTYKAANDELLCLLIVFINASSDKRDQGWRAD